MNFSFAKLPEICTQKVIDSDSGLDSSSSLLNDPTTEINNTNMTNSMPIYISEDALLEKPDIINNSFHRSSQETDVEILDASVKTVSTNYSGFQDESISERSVIIKTISPIKHFRNGLNTSTSTQDSFLNESVDISLDTSGVASDVSNLTESEDTSKIHAQITKFINDQNILKQSNINKTPQKKYNNKINSNVSPELFSDEENLDELDVSETTQQRSFLQEDESFIHDNDRLLIRKVNKTLNGLLPPPSLKVVNFTVEEMLNRLQCNKHLFTTVSSSNSTSVLDENRANSLLVTSTFENVQNLHWPLILRERYHGLHHNRSKLSEKFEDLCTKYGLRYIGGETQSSCTVFDVNNPTSPSKRKNSRLRWAIKSPGRRLSHLARRRITFSSANLQNTAASTSLSHSRQILIDAKKIELLSRRRSPKKKSPRKTPKKSPRKSPRKRVKTPGSSTKKNVTKHLQTFEEEERDGSIPSTSLLRASATKRALFQSPDKDKCDVKQLLFHAVGTKSTNRSPFKKLTPKRALFTSPLKNSPTKSNNFDNKRKRTDNDENKPAKLARSISMVDANTKSESNQTTYMQRTRSDTSILSLQSYPGELSAHHKKKLQWAVYEALRSQKVGINHPQFKTFASVLARVTRRFLPNLSANVPRPEGGTSERMLRIARQHVFAVTRGKTVDEIIQSVIESRAKIPVKRTGYVGIADENEKNIKNKENIFHNNIMCIGKNSSDVMLKKNSNDVAILKKVENRIDRVRKVINFDGDNKR